MNAVMSLSNLSDIDQTKYYSDEKRNRINSSTPPMNTKIIEELFVPSRSVIKVSKSSSIISVFIGGVLLFFCFYFRQNNIATYRTGLYRINYLMT